MTVSQSWRVRLSRRFVAALLDEVSGLLFVCFPFGPGLQAYGAGLSQGFRTRSTGMEAKMLNFKKSKNHDVVYDSLHFSHHNST
jgi:hypothetical protein